MPELPEVETVVRTLENQLQQAEIKEVKVYYPRIVDGDVQQFCSYLKGQHFRRFLRRGKYLLLEMDTLTLVVHLRMEGKFFVYATPQPVAKHVHVVFCLKDGSELHYQDVRKFGRFHIIPKSENYNSFHHLGVEPLSASMTPEYLYAQAQKRGRKPIKSLLLDQYFIAGIGNIYADEALYLAQIHPLTPAFYVSLAEWKVLCLQIRQLLRSAIEAGGTTIRSYTSSLGVTGLFQFSLHAYGRDKKPCERCQTPLEKIVVGGRGTHFCPHCQRQKRWIAITGGIGSGKSSVASLLRECGKNVFDFDDANKRLLENPDVLKTMQQMFPDTFHEGKLQKDLLSKKIFHNAAKRKRLEAFLHPRLWEAFVESTAFQEYSFAEVPLLYEAKWEKRFDQVVVVAAPQKIRISRLRAKGMSRQEILARMQNQIPLHDKIKRADVVLHNGKDRKEVTRELIEWLKDYDWK